MYVNGKFLIDDCLLVMHLGGFGTKGLNRRSLRKLMRVTFVYVKKASKRIQPQQQAGAAQRDDKAEFIVAF